MVTGADAFIAEASSETQAISFQLNCKFNTVQDFYNLCENKTEEKLIANYIRCDGFVETSTAICGYFQTVPLNQW